MKKVLSIILIIVMSICSMGVISIFADESETKVLATAVEEIFESSTVGKSAVIAPEEVSITEKLINDISKLKGNITALNEPAVVDFKSLQPISPVKGFKPNFCLNNSTDTYLGLSSEFSAASATPEKQMSFEEKLNIFKKNYNMVFAKSSKVPITLSVQKQYQEIMNRCKDPSFKFYQRHINKVAGAAIFLEHINKSTILGGISRLISMVNKEMNSYTVVDSFFIKNKFVIEAIKQMIFLLVTE
ncbi:MAG: hypothetical protein RUMPE_00503 [Eubacteriales bacterium SKADARSKE-1]|nr:hypothetical protein [Eubacteriales bacterium SKADARSKE-1]